MNSESTSITTPFRCLQMKPFPIGVCILVLDSDRSSIEMTEALLASYQYEVIVAERATEALLMVRENRCKIDIVLTEFDLPDMDGLKFVEKVLEIRSLPVLFLSNFENYGAKIECLLEGAEFCYDKPLHDYTAKNLWQFSLLKRDSTAISEISDNTWVTPVSRNANMHNVDDVTLENRNEVVAYSFRVTPKKRQISWTPELHGKFVVAVNTIGFSAARPKSILKRMNTPELTTGKVSSHWQRYRAQMNGEAPQTMPLRMEENKSIFNMNPELRAIRLLPFPFPEGSIAKNKSVGCDIYYELARQWRVQEEFNNQTALLDLNLGLNSAGTSLDEYDNGNHAWNWKKILPRGRLPRGRLPRGRLPRGRLPRGRRLLTL